MEDAGKKEQEEPVVVAVPKPMLSRPLYTNPVCLLTSRANDEERPNVMTITWVTAINNDGWFTMSVNQTRHTAAILARSTDFGMEELVFSIGKCSGSKVDKFTTLNIPTCKPGWDAWDGVGVPAIAPCVAHMMATKLDARDVAGHVLFTCQVTKAWVRGEYWTAGKLFAPTGPDVPPYLTFFGSGQFGYVRLE